MINKFISKNRLILIILLLGVLFRIFQASEMFMFTHDHDLAGWIVKDIVVDKHIRLIGQETSTKGVFIGPLYYYLLIPFYLMVGMSPIGGLIMTTLLGLFTIWSFYFVVSKVHNKNAGLIAGVLYAVSLYTVLNDREAVPTMPVFLWTVWFYYAINLLLKGKQKVGFLLTGLLAGLIWHLNFALGLLLPLIPLSIYLSKKKINYSKFMKGLVVFGVMSLPLLVFEFRHSFIQTKAIITSLTTNQQAILSGIDQFTKVIYSISHNLTHFLWGPLPNLSFYWAPLLVTLLFIYSTKTKLIEKKQSIIMFIWFILFIVFFSLYSKTVSEYYLNGVMVLWITVLSVFFSKLLSSPKTKSVAVILLLIFIIFNFNRLTEKELVGNKYVEKKALVAQIKADAKKHNYPCISVSYITDPGYNMGYRYLFWLEEMHVNLPITEAPVYTIVFPHSKVGRIDEGFGALGLIFPDYDKYNSVEVESICSGDNQNLTEPMILFTK